MKPLLTWNGIPPQITSSLTHSQQQSVVSYASDSKEITHSDWRYIDDVPIQPFANVVAGAANAFLHWGASVGERHKISLISSFVRTGKTTFADDMNLHSDSRDAFSKLQEEGLLGLRLLCVSNATADFVDLTKQENMGEVLDRHRIDNGRFFKPELLTLAKTRGQVIRPNPWDVIIFDAAAPHIPKGALQPNQRILQHAWIDMKLPFNWRARVTSGDVPKLQPA